jgi:hypothetical protein
MEQTLQSQYNLIKEGKGNKAVFLKSAYRLFPDMLSPVNTFEDTIKILKNRSIISEGIGGLVTTGRKQDWHAIFNENMTAYKEVDEKKKEPSKEITDMATRGYDYKDEKNYDNVFGQEFLKGYYTELKDPKNADKHVEELRAIVAKNLAKDINHYVKDGQFGIKGVGYQTEAPGLGTPKEPKGKYKSSGYGDLKESVLRSQIQLLIKEVLKENHKGTKTVKFNGETWSVTGTSVDGDGDKFIDIELNGKTHMNVPISAVQMMGEFDDYIRGKETIEKSKKDFGLEYIPNVYEGLSDDALFSIIAKHVEDGDDIEKEIDRYELKGYEGLSDVVKANLSPEDKATLLKK